MVKAVDAAEGSELQGGGQSAGKVLKRFQNRTSFENELWCSSNGTNAAGITVQLHHQDHQG